jgi:glycosyltransferase involved in cell wall biosynthesis
MNDSKFDDYQRILWREFGKKVMYLPYWGGIAASHRSADYMRFLGVMPSRIESNYDTLSVERIRMLSGAQPAPAGAPFADRHFTIVARLVPKKNLSIALEAYSKYCEQVEQPRGLHICGAGPLEAELRRLAEARGLKQLITFHGFVQSDQVSRILATSLALLLPSTEEQFGLVVIEALAMGVPVILSDQCGARDALVRSGLNGFVVEPDNPAGFAFFLKLLHTEEKLWCDMCTRATEFAQAGDVAQFARAVTSLVNKAEKRS